MPYFILPLVWLLNVLVLLVIVLIQMIKISETAKILNVSVSLIKLRLKEGVITSQESRGNLGTRYFAKEEIERYAKIRGVELTDYDFMTREELLEVVKGLNK